MGVYCVLWLIVLEILISWNKKSRCNNSGFATLVVEDGSAPCQSGLSSYCHQLLTGRAEILFNEQVSAFHLQTKLSGKIRMFFLWALVKNWLKHSVSLAHIEDHALQLWLGGMFVCLGVSAFIFTDVHLTKEFIAFPFFLFWKF